jgi:hypothetical protein
VGGHDEVAVKTYECGACGNTIYFENVECVRCGHALGFQPARLDMVSLAPLNGGHLREIGAGSTAPVAYCANTIHGVCNWLVPGGDEPGFCIACALNRKIPDLSYSANLRAWGDFERAKKRLVYSLLRFGLPLDGAVAGKGALAFDFVHDALTGHLDGVITIAVAEANAVERERQRQAMSETYRSLLGHMRHEIGHYYWMLLIQETEHLSEFRQLFGDERQNYSAALDRHRDLGPPPDWALRHVSAYASAHPWEDWAETWAHYLHMVDALDTAAAHDFEPRTSGFARAGMRGMQADDVYRTASFGALMERWIPLTLALNEINRSMGHNDFYPFMIPEVATTKLNFVHRIVREQTLRFAEGVGQVAPMV